jgi:flagellar biosynthesis protein FlhG
MTAPKPAPKPAQPALKMRPRPSPKRLTIASGKGGVGKTWTAVTLAQAFALQGERVLLVDGDLGLANVDVQLGIEPKSDLGAVIAGQTDLAGAVCPYAGGPAKAAQGGFDVLPGRSGTGSLASLGEPELHKLAKGLVALETRYDRVLVDLGAGLDKVVTTLCTADAGSQGHAILVVLTAEPTSLTDAYAFIKIIRMHAPEADLRVVVNRANSLTEGKRTYQALSTATQNFLGFAPELVGVIPDDTRVADAIRHQTALFLRHPQSKAGAGVMALAGSLARNAQ